MKLTKSILRGMIREVINEKEDQEGGRIDMDDPVMQKTGWYSDNPELTVGGVLKQGEKHPAYKDALKAAGKEKDKGGEDKPEPKQTKISSDPFAGKGDDKPSDDTSGKPIPAKDLTDIPGIESPDSRGTSWDSSYYGADDSKEWEDQYKEAEEDGDEEELAQIKWFGEKQGWGDNGELHKGESITHPLKKMFNRIGG